MSGRCFRRGEQPWEINLIVQMSKGPCSDAAADSTTAASYGYCGVSSMLTMT